MASTKTPNILIIWGDDIGTSNLSIFTKGLMGYRTPNIDRIAEEGILFIDSYGEQSCTAGRSAFTVTIIKLTVSLLSIPNERFGSTRRIAVLRVDSTKSTKSTRGFASE